MPDRRNPGDSGRICRYSYAMGFVLRPASIRSLRAFRIGLILLLLLGAPLNLALPRDMTGSAMADAAMTGSHGPNCPGSMGGDHGSRHDHAFLCLFCVALGGPSLAGGSLELVPKPVAPAVTVISFEVSRNEIVDGHRERTQCCRDPPMTA